MMYACRFSYKKMLALSGNTAPYMLYAVARINGIRRKIGQSEQVFLGRYMRSTFSH